MPLPSIGSLARGGQTLDSSPADELNYFDLSAGGNNITGMVSFCY